MRIGAQVSGAGGLVAALGRAEAMGAEVVQVFTQSPRQWRPYSLAEDLGEVYRAAEAESSVAATYCHATYLINLATANPELVERSFSCLVENLSVAALIGAKGVVLHVGSHLGAGFAAVRSAVAAALVRAHRSAGERTGRTPPPILIENTAGAGGTIGRSFAELAELIEEAGGDEHLGVCLDTQHLFASGISYATVEEADAVVAALDAAVGVSRLGCIHLNDSKVALGSNRDRHENLGAGAIGTAAFSALLGHPLLQHAPALLETPGEGDGPRAVDLVLARRLVDDGVALRAPRRPTHRQVRRPRRAAEAGAA